MWQFIYTESSNLSHRCLRKQKGLEKSLVADETFGGCNTCCGQRLLEHLGALFLAEDPGQWFHKAVPSF